MKYKCDECGGTEVNPCILDTGEFCVAPDVCCLGYTDDGGSMAVWKEYNPKPETIMIREISERDRKLLTKQIIDSIRNLDSIEELKKCTEKTNTKKTRKITVKELEKWVEFITRALIDECFYSERIDNRLIETAKKSLIKSLKDFIKDGVCFVNWRNE